MREINCPLCQKAGPQLVRTIAAEPLTRQWLADFQIDITNEFHGQSVIELWQCHECHMQFFLPETIAGSPLLYDALQKFEWYYMPRKWEHEVALHDLRGCGKVLEVGCGSGNFMILAKEKLSLALDGMEQNARAIGEAEQRGLSVLRCSLEEAAETSAGQYDAVCSFQVLEHVTHPGNFIKACSALLRSGGKLLIGVPNADSFLRHQFNLLDMPPHHMSRWSVQTLGALTRLFPLGPPHVKLEPLADYHVENYVDAYAGLLARGPFSLLNHPGVKSRFTRFVRHFALQRFLRGQTVYACYERN